MNILWISEIPWGLMKQRHHHLIENFPKEWKILFAEPIVLERYSPVFPKREDNVTRFAIPLLTGRAARKSLHERFLAPLSEIYIRLILRLFKMKDDIILVSSNVYAAPFTDKLKAQLICYDCNDNHKAIPNVPDWAGVYVDHLFTVSDVIFTPSRSLYNRLKAEGKNVYRIGNGCDSNFGKNRGECPPDMKNIPRPIAGYVGVISEWFDFDLLLSLLGRFPDLSLVLIGPSEDYSKTRRGMSRLLSYKNVYALGKKDYKELPDYISRFDAGIIPFLKTELTNSVNPNKLYEYAAMGIPIVTTNFSEDLEEFSKEITVAQNAEEFLDAIGDIIAKRYKYDADTLRNMALSNTWDTKSEEMVRIIATEYMRKKHSSALQ